MAETQSTVPTTTEATAPTGDIKIFIDAFNKDFDVEIKKLVDAQQNYKNVYADAIKITTPKEGPWPNDPKVVTIGDLFKYTFPDINSDKEVKPPIPSAMRGDRPGVERWDNYFGWQKDLSDSKDEKIKKMYGTILNGINSNSELLDFQDLKKPGITNPSLWSPGQYYFDVFMRRMLSESGPLKDPSDRNGGFSAFGGNILEGGGWQKGWLEANGGSASVSNFTKDGQRDDGSFDYSDFYQILTGGYEGSSIKYLMELTTGVNIGLSEYPSTKLPTSFPSLFTQYGTGPLSEFISIENGEIIYKDPKFRFRGEITDPSNKEIELSKVKALTDLTGYTFTGYYLHMLLYKAFIQAGDNYKSVVLPLRNPEPEPVDAPVTVLAKVVAPTAVGEVQFKFNVEKKDTFIVVGGTVSPPLEFIIVPNDGTTYIIETPDDIDIFNTLDDIDDEYEETEFGSTEEETIAIQALYSFANIDNLDIPEIAKRKAKEYKEKLDNADDGDNNSVTTAQLKNAGGSQDFWTLVAICSREDGDKQAWCDIAQTIYNRVGSGAYGANNITTAVTSKSQYEPTWSFPRKGRKNVPNAEWKKILDINSAAVASGQSVSRLKEVAEALKDKTLQDESKRFVGGRTDFLGLGQPAKAMTRNGSKIQRTSRNNQIGYSFNYKGKVSYSRPKIVDTISIA